MELPTVGPAGDPVQSIVDFFGRKAAGSSPLDHSRVTSEIVETSGVLESTSTPGGLSISCLNKARQSVRRPPAEGADAQEWVPGIEALLGIAAAAVFVDHSWALANGAFLWMGLVPGLGTWGVNVFFLVSGASFRADYSGESAVGDRRSTTTSGDSLDRSRLRRLSRLSPSSSFAYYAWVFQHVGPRQGVCEPDLHAVVDAGTLSGSNVDDSPSGLSTIDMMSYAVMPTSLTFSYRVLWLSQSLVVGGRGVGF